MAGYVLEKKVGWFLGATAGLFIGGPLGAIVGGVLQHMATKPSGSGASEIRENKSEAIFVTNLTVIITKVAMADGDVSAAERATIHRFFAEKLKYFGDTLEYIDRVMNETELQDPPLEPVCKEFLRYTTPEMRMFLLNILYEVAFSDHSITSSEQAEIDEIARLLYIPADVHMKIKNIYTHTKRNTASASPVGAKDNYSTLGVERKATNEEIKKAYRTLAMQYHPDKVNHLGKELIEFANKKFVEINTAYEAIKKERGI